MKYSYIDLGAYNGDTFLSFMANQKLIAPPESFDVYLVEPNPAFKRILDSLAEKFTNIKEVIHEAAWIKDGTAPFAQDTNDLAYGSTLMASKEKIWNRFDKITVKTFDFSKWLKRFKDDYVIVKMDIEGAEFPLLEKMMRDGTAKYMDQLWVEVHPNKLKDYTTTYSNDMVERLRFHTEVTLWH